jgi:amino acid adenylation domain-containing protein
MNDIINIVSRIQEQFWVLNTMNTQNTAYHIPSLFKITGTLNIEALNNAVNVIISRHEILRTYFIQKGDLKQFTKPEFSIQIQTSTFHEELNEKQLPQIIIDNIHKPFNLSELPLIRANVYYFSNNCSLLVFVFPHIIIDLYSKEIFARELTELYNAIDNNKSLPVFQNATNYCESLNAFDQWIKSEAGIKMLTEWTKDLPDITKSIDLPSDKSSYSDLSPNGKRLLFSIHKDLSSKIDGFAKQQSLNSFTILLTCYAILLYRLSNQESITIGVPFTNRRSENSKNTFGCFVNVLPLEVDFSNNPTGLDLLKQIRLSLLKLHRRQEIPYIELVSLSKNSAGLGHNPFFQTGFTFEPLMHLGFQNVTVEPIAFERNGSQLDMFLTLWSENDEYRGFWEYASEKFNISTIEKWIDIFKLTVNNFTSNPSTHIGNIDILTQTDTQLLDLWNSTESIYDMQSCIHELFEKQAYNHPNKIALYSEYEKHTYSELNKKANSIANLLVSRGVIIGDIVTICTERSPLMIIGILAILKAGAAYLPISPDYPADRIQSILDDAQPKVILTTNKSSKNLESTNVELIFLELLNTSQQTNNLELKINSSNLAYIIYTSGSTGKPKGAMIEHHSVLNRIGWMQKAYPINEQDVLLQKTTITFDVSVWELFWWFFNGSSLVLLAPEGEKNPEVIIRTIHEFKVSVIHFVPSMFNSFVSYFKAYNNQKKLESLNHIFLSGEALPATLVESFYSSMKTFKTPLLVNLYGPTEATVDVSYFNCIENSSQPIYIGKPIDNTKLFVINQHQQVQPIGVPGELIITGVNLSRGYLNRPELNLEKFIQFSYNQKTFRAYRTGDLAKWTPDGNIEYIGRIDNQIKLRGFRIELGDIESALLQLCDIESCAVILHKANPENPQLIAYYSLKKNINNISDKEIKTFLGSKLPDFMLPSMYIHVPEMPLTNSGKLDRKKLPAPLFKSDLPKTKETNITSLESSILEIWKQLLNINSIGRDQNFFDAGGNSLLAIRMVGTIKEKLNVSINIITLMQYTTIKTLAKYISTLK